MRIRVFGGSDVQVSDLSSGQYGKKRNWRAYESCPGVECRGEYQSFPPGVLTEDGATEIRTCPEEGCDGTVETTAWYSCADSEADVFDLDG